MDASMDGNRVNSSLVQHCPIWAVSVIRLYRIFHLDRLFLTIHFCKQHWVIKTRDQRIETNWSRAIWLGSVGSADRTWTREKWGISNQPGPGPNNFKIFVPSWTVDPRYGLKVNNMFWRKCILSISNNDYPRMNNARHASSLSLTSLIRYLHIS